MNWPGRSLKNIRTVVEPIGGHHDHYGPSLFKRSDRNWYPKGERISDAEYATIPLAPHDWHGE